MVRKASLKVGTGAECSVLLKFLHPAKRVKEVIINKPANGRVDGLVAVKVETKTVNRKDQECVFFCHNSFPNEFLWCCKRYCKVTNEGLQ